MTEYSPAETGEYPRIFPNFQNYVCCEKDLKDNKHDSLHMAQNMFGYLSLDIICSLKLTVFLELHSWKTVYFSEQIMSAAKYPCIFSCQMEAIVYLYGRTSAQWQGESWLLPFPSLQTAKIDCSLIDFSKLFFQLITQNKQFVLIIINRNLFTFMFEAGQFQLNVHKLSDVRNVSKCLPFRYISTGQFQQRKII